MYNSLSIIDIVFIIFTSLLVALVSIVTLNIFYLKTIFFLLLKSQGMKSLFLILFITAEAILAAALISFVWTLLSNGTGLQTTTYLGKITNVIVILLGIVLPISGAIVVGGQIEKLTKK